ncbi:MAG TPA: Nramp family divalent metal transporter [Candidatus Saccharimonadales bacterium]|nr:Nramp family divalent metal transporter [Candidatus Saccharimonadales bacterium]
MVSPQHKLLTKTAEAPAVMLGRAVVATQIVSENKVVKRSIKKSKDYWLMLGPGLTTGASDDDPSGIATYSQVGAQFGYGLLWMAPWSLPLMATVQEMCARIGLATGRGLAGNIRVFFSKYMLYLCASLLFAANSFNIGADLGAMAKATQLLAPSFSFGWLVVGFAVFSLLLQIFTPYARYARYLKWLALILLSYILSAVMAHLDWAEVLKNGFIPHLEFTKEQIILICAILGTTISPYLFFWQTSQEVEQAVEKGELTVKERKGADAKEIRSMRIDVWSGMFLSNLVMFFIIAAAGGILYPHGITEITSAAQAAEALRPFAGNATFFLFAVGIIGTGLLAIPVLAGSSSYALAESLRWREGLYRNLEQAKAFYGIIIISMVVGLGINFLGIDPIKALIYSALGNAFVAPVVLYFIVRISSSKKFMGPWANKPLTTAIGWFVFGLMTLSALAAIYALF